MPAETMTYRDAVNTALDEALASSDDVEVAVGDRVEASGIDGDGHHGPPLPPSGGAAWPSAAANVSRTASP